ncbi:hypothetical protein B0T26DRAFT_681077 [Lasiosphaeria miniovina]|uniref:Uncharacterized protein n=1 Tax=Lasiosphaeria miniovina TaxID=1954250 RepID=A0AA39ZTP4_9PEZI|nr:uncharacterized protein B0T26DRAFT_681077 [Lasiosphaeria miniovina]KAK0703395.1 hypothetical protein B0T26DRAFT_681077 [Lasiosphaeria miniovina]
MARLQMIMTVIITVLASVLGSIPAGADIVMNFWDAIIRHSKRIAGAPEAAGSHSWIHPAIQRLDQFLGLFRDQQTAEQAITRLQCAFKEINTEAKQQRDLAIAKEEKAVKSATAITSRDKAIA